MQYKPVDNEPMLLFSTQRGGHGMTQLLTLLPLRMVKLCVLCEICDDYKLSSQRVFSPCESPHHRCHPAHSKRATAKQSIDTFWNATKMLICCWIQLLSNSHVSKLFANSIKCQPLPLEGVGEDRTAEVHIVFRLKCNFIIKWPFFTLFEIDSRKFNKKSVNFSMAKMCCHCSTTTEAKCGVPDCECGPHHFMCLILAG